MNKKSIVAGFLTSALLASTAFAQTPAPAASPADTSATISSTSPSSFDGNWRTSKVVGLNVYNDSNESLGAINDLLTDKSGKIVAVVVGVGGFLGVGERYVAIPFEKVKFSNDPVVSTSAANTGGAMPGARPVQSTTTTGAATGATAPMATPATPKANPWYPDHAVISATKDELKSMAEFKYTN
jgi:sporulation protein YlmC with PRC-barrel domain